LAAAVSPLVAARWSARSTSAMATRHVWTVAQIVMAAGVIVPIGAHGLPGIAFAACAVGGTFMVVTMAGMQEARRVAIDAAPGLMGAMTAAFAAGQIVGPLCVSAVVAAGFSVAPALCVAAAVLAISALTLEVPRPRPR